MSAFETALDNGEVPSRVLSEIAARRVAFGQPSVEKRAGARVFRNRGAAYVVRREQEGVDDKLNVYDYPSAAAALRTSPGDALPAITLEGKECETGEVHGTVSTWLPLRDLLDSDAFDARFRRRGRGRRPRARCASATTSTASGPTPGRSFTAAYRVGNGAAGNVGAEALAPRRHRRRSVPSTAVAQPAAGARRRRAGDDRAGPPERARAPSARRSAPSPERLRRRRRSATPRCSAPRPPSAGRAAGTRSSSPSTASAGGRSTPTSRRSCARILERYRMAGHDLEVDAPRFVAARDRAAASASRPATSAATCRRALLERASATGVLPDGRRGSSTPTTSPSASRSTSAALRGGPGGRRASTRSRSRRFQRPGRAGRRRRSTAGVLHARPAGDRPARQRPELPRARRAAPRRWRGQVSDADSRDPRADAERLRLLRGHSTARRRSRSTTGPGCRRSPTASARTRSFRAVDAGAACPTRDLPALARAEDPRRRRLRHRAARRLGDGRRRAHLLPGAHRQRGYLRTATERALGARAGAPHRLRAAPRRRRLDLPRLHPRGHARRAREASFHRAGHARAERPRPGRAAADLRDDRGASRPARPGTRCGRARTSRTRSPPT